MLASPVEGSLTQAREPCFAYCAGTPAAQHLAVWGYTPGNTPFIEHGDGVVQKDRPKSGPSQDAVGHLFLYALAWE